jgi:hypothetical protein
MQDMQRVFVDGELSKSSADHLNKVCHTRWLEYYHYCTTRPQMFALRASSRTKRPAASIVGFDIINNPDDFYHTIMSTGISIDVAEILGIRQILESRRADPTKVNRYGLNAEGHALFDYLDILVRRCGVFIVPWGSFQDFCSLHQQAENEMGPSLQLFLSDVHHFLSQQEEIISRLRNQTCPQGD